MDRTKSATGDWISAARGKLLELRGGANGWGYRPASEPCVEPTVLCSLALLATAQAGGEHAAQRSAKSAADWLVDLQQSNGSVGVSARLPQPRWCTTHALLLWSALSDYASERRRATKWLLAESVHTFEKQPGAAVGHDTTLEGWPWVEDTHAWIEPTALAILALRRQGLLERPRTLEGLRVIRNRVIPTGGWNVGNNIVFGAVLRPRPSPTGLALLALAGIDEKTDLVERSLAYLEAELPTIRAAQSLAWGLLALTAWERRPKQADAWLAEAFPRAAARSDPGPQLAYLLLASRPESLTLLGSEAVRE